MTARRTRWHTVYFALAFFDVVTVSGSLYLNHQIMNLYGASVAENVVWAERLDAYAELGHWASATNAPGNDVFDSRDVPAERARLEAARAAFDEHLLAARADLVAEPDRAAAELLAGDLDRVSVRMEEMTAEAARIFAFFEASQPERAGERMATMDRKYAGLGSALADLSGRVRAVQGDRFQQQLAEAQQLRRAEWGIAGLILLMVAGALLFGHRVRAQMEAAEREREAHNEAVRRAQAAAEASNRAKSRFLATMSHEIRTPLNGVLGMTELLLGTPLRSDQRECASTIQQSGLHLLEVISDILDFSKIEADRIELESAPLDPGELIEDVAAACAERAHRKGLELVYEVDERLPRGVLGDRTRLRQVLLNLTSNAVKFTLRGEVAVRALLVAERGAQARIQFSVSDTGIGIGEAERARIFAPFTQADESTTRRFGGTGLGLAISKELVERMGGVLGVESVVGIGSRFSFEIELHAVEAEPAPGEASADLAGLRVLVVDDNATNRTILMRTLATWGAEGVECAGGSEAIATLRRFRAQGAAFDLGVFDLAMPGMDGLSLVEAIESDPSLGALPVVMLTSMDVASDLAERSLSSVTARLTKPCRRAQLRRALLHATGRGGRTSGSAAAAAAAPSGLASNVLLVEDNEVNQQVSLAMLRRLGCRASLAATAAEAIRQARAVGFDLILMDCELPDLDGVEATRRIRAAAEAQGLARVPIVALTAHATESQRQACREAGMDDFLTKPLTLEVLAQCVETHGRPRRDAPARPSAPRSSTLRRSTLDELEALGPGLRQQVVERFLESSARHEVELADALRAADASRLAARAHALRSSALQVGAELLAGACKELEAEARAGRLDAARVEALLAALAAAREDLSVEPFGVGAGDS